MKICPICQRCYEDTDAACITDHSALLPARPGSRLIGDKYLLQRLLGRGNLGAVYAGTRVYLDRPLAIKLLLPKFSAAAFARFQQITRAIATLHHPHIVSIYEHGSLLDGGAYIVMEMVNGQSLGQHLKESGPVPVVEAVNLAQQIVDGLEAAYRQGILHGSLKPSNIILRRDEQDDLQVKVMDFGVAELKELTPGGADAATAPMPPQSTLSYLSPEECAGGQRDARSDIYSLGAILYEMLAGRVPFDGPTVADILSQQMQELPPPLKTSCPDVPEQLSELVMQSLSKDPSMRPQTWTDFANRLSYIAESTVQIILASPLAETSLNSFEDTLIPEPALTPATSLAAGQSLLEPATDSPAHQDGQLAERDDSMATVETPAALPPEEPFAETLGGVAVVHQEEASNQDSAASKNATPAVTKTDAAPLPVAISRVNIDIDAQSSTSASARIVYSPHPHRRRLGLWYASLLLAVALSAGAVTWVAIQRRWLSPSDSPAASDSTTPVDAHLPQPSLSSATVADDPSPVKSTRAATDLSRNSPAGAATGSGSGKQIEDPRQAASQKNERVVLRAAVGDWLAATNSRDINKQMTFYAPTLTVYYRVRNVSRLAVKAEKTRLFGRASQINISATEPEITFSNDGLTAIMRFNKAYVIGEGRGSRRGEVVQELIWRKIDGNWRIISERDVQVIRK